MVEEITDIVRIAVSADLDQRHTAFAQLVSRFQDMAYGCAYGVLGDTHLAQDVAQESFLTAYRDLEQLRDPAAFPAWFKRIVMKKAYRDARSRRSMTTQEDVLIDTPSGEPDSEHRMIRLRRTRQSRLPSPSFRNTNDSSPFSST